MLTYFIKRARCLDMNHYNLTKPMSSEDIFKGSLDVGSLFWNFTFILFHLSKRMLRFRWIVGLLFPLPILEFARNIEGLFDHFTSWLFVVWSLSGNLGYFHQLIGSFMRDIETWWLLFGSLAPAFLAVPAVFSLRLRRLSRQPVNGRLTSPSVNSN